MKNTSHVLYPSCGLKLLISFSSYRTDSPLNLPGKSQIGSALHLLEVTSQKKCEYQNIFSSLHSNHITHTVSLLSHSHSSSHILLSGISGQGADEQGIWEIDYRSWLEIHIVYITNRDFGLQEDVEEVPLGRPCCSGVHGQTGTRRWLSWLPCHHWTYVLSLIYV